MKILVCVSDFPFSITTLDFARRFLSVIKPEIDILTIRPEGEPIEKGTQIIEKSADLLNIESRKGFILQGSPADEILEHAGSRDYDLVIIGAQDKPTFGELILGSVARKVTANVDSSVLVVRQPTDSLEYFLVCTGAGVTSKPTMNSSINLALTFDASVTLLHVSPVIPSMFAGLPKMEHNLADLLSSGSAVSSQLRRSIASFQESGVDTVILLRHGIPAEEILREVDIRDYDLVVVGGERKSGINAILQDDIAMPVVQNCPRPVLVLKKELGIPPQIEIN